MTAREAMARLEREGWQATSGKGSHTKFQKAGYPTVIVSNHRGDIPTGTLRAVCKAAGWEYPPRP